MIDNNLKEKEGLGTSEVGSEVVAEVVERFHLAIKKHKY